MLRNATAIVLGFCQGEHLLRGCLQSLLQTTNEDVEIIVVVNGPAANQREIGDWPDRIRLLRRTDVSSNAAALNTGVAATEADMIVLADYDMIFTRGWMDALRSALAESDADAAGSMLLDPRTGAVSEFGIAYTEFNGAHPYKDRLPDDPLVARRHFPQAICSGGLLVPRRIFRGLSGFDETLATMYGDVDFCLRMKRAGYKIVAEPTSRIYHLGGWDTLRERPYKNLLLKGDHKGAFMWRNRDTLQSDLRKYYERSFGAMQGKLTTKYVACQSLTVANPNWYTSLFVEMGGQIYETHVRPSGRRDAEQENLLELYGHEVLTLSLPIVYFIDRFIAVRGNNYWWRVRSAQGDLVVDRNGNCVGAEQVLGSAYCYT